MTIKYILVALVGLLIALAICYPVLLLCRKLHFSQTILHYVEAHAGKKGTPTMGGIIFIFAGILAFACFSGPPRPG